MDGSDRAFAETHDHISRLQTGALSRAVFIYGDDQHTCFHGQIVEADNAAMKWHILTGDADITAPDPAITDQPAGHQLGCVTGDGKTDSLGRTNHGRIHSNYFAGRVDER